jgi:uncharacterized membrane protein
LNTSAGHRLQFIDLLRGAAVLVMIETHVVNALLRPDLKTTDIHAVLTFVNGLVAPSFLFCAGLALALSFHRKWRTYVLFEKPLWRYCVRLLFIMVVAYSLHLPFFSLHHLQTLAPGDPAWLPFYQTDILQTIAVSLFALVVFAVCSRVSRVFLWVTGSAAVLLVLAAPLVREMDFSSLPVWLRPYLTTRVKTQFPLFPWAAFVLTGALAGWWYLQSKKDGRERTFIKRLSIVAAIAIPAALLIEILPFTVYPNHNFWRASPEFFIVRAGLVVLLLTGLWWFEQRRKLSPRSVFLIFGQESLLVYVVHLLIVYGYTYEFSFVRYFGPHMNYLECLPLVVGLMILMYLMAIVWHWLRQWNGKLAWFVEVITLAVIVLMFVVKEN